MTVTETRTGTMMEEKGRSTVSPETEVKTPELGSKVSSEEDQPIYTQTQYDALLHGAQSEWGRKTKIIEEERDNLKSQMQIKGSELEDNKAEIETLEKRIDALTNEDPSRFDAIKELRVAREERRQLKAKLLNLDTREHNFVEREKRVNSFEREILIESISDEYEDGDAVRLKKAISGFENPTEEQIRSIADIFWQKKTKEGEKPKAPKHYSGKSEGGLSYFTRAQVADRKFWEEHKDAILKAEAEGRIRE